MLRRGLQSGQIRFPGPRETSRTTSPSTRRRTRRPLKRVPTQGGAPEGRTRGVVAVRQACGRGRQLPRRGFHPPPKPPPRNRCAGKAGARTWKSLAWQARSVGSNRLKASPTDRCSAASADFARATIGEDSEGAVEASSERTPQRSPFSAACTSLTEPCRFRVAGRARPGSRACARPRPNPPSERPAPRRP